MTRAVPLPATAGATQRLGAFAAGVRWADAPEAVRRTALRSLLNGLATALGSAHDPAVAAAATALGRFGGAAQATVIGRGERLDAGAAAFVNAVAMNLLDFDDTHLPTVIHVTAPVLAPALAVAEWRGADGAACLEAFAAGAEIACRVGLAVTPGHYRRGWHITSTAGCFGAAAAAGKLLGLDAEGIAAALGLASSLACGHVENLPSAGKNASVGSAARSGILAALLAEAGQRAAPLAIEGPLGWARACGDEPDLDAIEAGLGDHWEFARNTFKPYPAGIVMHAVIDAALDLRGRHGLDPSAIRTVAVHGDALLLARGDRVVRSARDARVSLQHCAAIALARGRAGPAEFEDAAVFDPEVAALRERVRAGRDDGLPLGAARVSVTLDDGRDLSATVARARGSLENPLSDAEIEDKLRAAVAVGQGTCHPETVIRSAWEIAEAGGLARLLAAVAG
ncbi:MmgE/PrpD family protein [Methylobacterium oryzihabitans]|uniref:MmgE/PrpD family protein n=1 Tax=Methylobacterium oryzihabitans TaxID=2499852 RepID=A0A437NW52_9HYPH|nr:MmgE/PrpD family protein [Methylobacterium oryzihabitans]RVU14234.1 MmgE/PrpD family protein [Methylobacterium oryzihabitans]